MKNNITQKLENILPKLITLWHGKKNSPVLNRDELNKITKAVKVLSKGLTEERVFIGEKYLNDPHFLGAYLLYYFPISFVQSLFALSLLSFKPKTALDIGAGPGPVSLALSESGVEKIVATDQSKPALKLAENIFKTFGKTLATKSFDLTKNPDFGNEKFDIITFGHVINELWSNNEDKIKLRFDFIEKKMELLNKEGLALIIEPALQKTARDMIKLRDLFLENGYHVLYPCIYKKNCPCLLTDNATCHSEINWQKPKMIENIAKEAGFKKESLKMSVFIIGKKESIYQLKNNDNFYLVVSDRMLSKSGKFRYIICGNEGRISLSMKKNINYSFKDNFLNLKRGDKIEFKGEKRENGYELLTGSSLKIKVCDLEAKSVP